MPYGVARRQLAARLGISTDEVTADPATVDAQTRAAILAESVVLGRRFGLAAKMVDWEMPRRAARAGKRGPAITMKDAQQAAMALEGIPRYDHIFIIMLENKATSAIRTRRSRRRSTRTSTPATSSPATTRRAIRASRIGSRSASGDDFGVDRRQAVELRARGRHGGPPGGSAAGGRAPCINATNHNLKHPANLFTAMTAAGMTWRVYSESMNPGRDWRLNGAATNARRPHDHMYPARQSGRRDRHAGPQTAVSRVACTCHQTQRARSLFRTFAVRRISSSNNRTMGGGQWDDAIRRAPSTPAGWNVDQFGVGFAVRRRRAVELPRAGPV